ncbi:MAG: SH3 domain-containing protein [Agathobacter sp.]|nr:SH3 domain-containing protein [Agathobacter sp.]
MKKSHRKDVIIARIIFAAMCVALVAIIIGLVMLVRAHKSDRATQQMGQTQTQTQREEWVPDVVEPETQTQTPEVVEMTYMWTTDGVNLRSEPNTDSAVVTVLGVGTQVRMIGEEDGWVKVSFNDQEGYIRADFLTMEQ